MLKRIVPDGNWYVLLSRLMKTNTNRQETSLLQSEPVLGL